MRVSIFFLFSFFYMREGNVLARLPGRILWCVHMGNFSPVHRDEFKWNIILYCSTVIALWTLVTLPNKANSHTPKVEIHTRLKLCYFGRYFVRAKLILFKKFRPGQPAGVFIWENFHPGYRDLGRKIRDLGNRASPASLISEHIDFFTKKKLAMWDLGNRANSVSRAHMKRPLYLIN